MAHLPPLQVIVNTESDNPFFHLALEEYAVRNWKVRSRAYLIFYVNRPAVVLGKHQVCWAEANIPFCRENDILIARRISGGGTVYHDWGNLNFSYITEHKSNTFNQYRLFLEPIIAILTRRGITVTRDSRNNLRLNGKKISGNAQFTSRGTLLSHGTLLFDLDSKKMHNALQPTLTTISHKGALSVRSPVTAINHHLSHPLTIEEFIASFVREYQLNIDQISDSQRREINDLAREKYATWSWIAGRSPSFSFTVSGFELQVVAGVITRVMALATQEPHSEFANISMARSFLEKNPDLRQQHPLLQTIYDISL